ncbi:MAG: hypothetical protein ABIK43_03560 [candidate division WOR-3 bacterium]
MDPARRIKKWDAKFNTARVKDTLDAMRPEMQSKVQSTFPDLTAMELQVKQVLDSKGVSIIQYPFYLSFGREIWRLIRHELSGSSLAREVAVLIMKWKDRGLSQTVLESIRSEVFNVPPPTP